MPAAPAPAPLSPSVQPSRCWPAPATSGTHRHPSRRLTRPRTPRPASARRAAPASCSSSCAEQSWPRQLPQKPPNDAGAPAPRPPRCWLSCTGRRRGPAQAGPPSRARAGPPQFPAPHSVRALAGGHGGRSPATQWCGEARCSVWRRLTRTTAGQPAPSTPWRSLCSRAARGPPRPCPTAAAMRRGRVPQRNRSWAENPRPAIRGAVAVPAALSSARRAGGFSCPVASPCANRSDVGRGRASTRPPAGGVLLGWRRTRGDGRLGSRACTTPPARGPWPSQTHRTVVIETPPVGVGQGGTWKHVLVSSVRRPGHRERRAHVPAERPDVRSHGLQLHRRNRRAERVRGPSAVPLGRLALCPHPLQREGARSDWRGRTQRRRRREPSANSSSVMSSVQRAARTQPIRVLIGPLKGRKWVMLKARHRGGPRVSVPHKVRASL